MELTHLPCIKVLNKWEKLNDDQRDVMLRLYPGSATITALHRDTLEPLMERILALLPAETDIPAWRLTPVLPEDDMADGADAASADDFPDPEHPLLQ
jgi:50S ribosomal subunit-associated GTPase HflX